MSRRQLTEMKNKMRPNINGWIAIVGSAVQSMVSFCYIAEDKKTAAQKSREGKLLQQLLVTVHRRNNIVDSMEEDRKRFICGDICLRSCDMLMFNVFIVSGYNRVYRIWWILFCFFVSQLPSVLWRCWLGGRKGIRPVKKLNGVVLAWLSVCSEVQTCICPADATATHCLLLQ